MIAKSLSTSQRYARLYEAAGKRAEFCQALYPLLLAHADDFGRLAGDVFTVKHLIIPASPRSESDVTAALEALHAVNLIVWYEIDGRKCIQIQDFDAYQQGLHKRTKSTFPEPSGKFREIPSELNRTEGKGTEQNRTEQNRAIAEVLERFEVWWSSYPKKVGKDAARREWLQRSPSAELLEVMLATLAAQRASAQWRKDDGQYIPHPRTWLHQGRWQDEAIDREQPIRAAWACPHLEHCSHRAMCDVKMGNPEKYPVKAAS